MIVMNPVLVRRSRIDRSDGGGTAGR